MFAEYTHYEVKVRADITICAQRGGKGPPLLLLHGFPQNHRIYHKIADELAENYSVVIPDLRGYGNSSKPASDDKHITYSKRIMAQDCADLMQSLGHGEFYVCGHDRGARVAHKLCVDRPDAVLKAILLDICPTSVMYKTTDFTFAKAYYHWFFLIQAAPFPEKLIAADPEAFAEHQMGRLHPDKSKAFFGKECYKSYVDQLKDPATVHAMCEDYRAAASIDIEDHTKDEEAGREINCPLMILWGKHGLIDKRYNATEEWRKVSSSSVEGEALDCGHYIPEEAPEALLGKILEFCKP